MSITKRSILILLLLSVLFISVQCTNKNTSGNEKFIDNLTICGLTENYIGWRVIVDGDISFIDLSPKDGVFLEMRKDDCQVQGFIHNDFWNDFSQDKKDAVKLDNAIQIDGILSKNKGDLLISIQKIY